MSLVVVPSTIGAAKLWVLANHRHHKPPVSGLFALAASDGEKIVGVAIVGRPVARDNQDGFTAEVTRLATDGTANACSILYAAAWRAARALGYRQLITYTLDSEPGASLVASGWKQIGTVTGRKWDTPTRRRKDEHPTCDKKKWAAP
jgi:hypothetical protein